MTRDNLAHRFWYVVIREVAAEVLKQTPYEEVDELNVDDLVREWQNETMPISSNLAWVMGELDYFRDIDLSGEEKISLSGKACGYPSVGVWDLTNKLFGYPNAQDAVTEESVHDFYCE